MTSPDHNDALKILQMIAAFSYPEIVLAQAKEPFHCLPGVNRIETGPEDG
jgi:hypothetical protein